MVSYAVVDPHRDEGVPYINFKYIVGIDNNTQTAIGLNDSTGLRRFFDSFLIPIGASRNSPSLIFRALNRYSPLLLACGNTYCICVYTLALHI